MQPIVSVIIPCYNQGQYLDRAVQSIINQTMTDWECIIVNDGSTDDTETKALSWVQRDARIHYYYKLNQGLAKARNTGLQFANGKYIQFLDSDDTIHPEKFSQQVVFMGVNKLDVSYTNFCLTNFQNSGHVKSIKLSLYKLILFWGIGASVPIHAFLYRRDFLTQNQLVFRSTNREDWDFHYNCFISSPKSKIFDHICGAMYFQNFNGMTGNPYRLQKGNFEFLLEEIPLSRKRDRWAWYLRFSSELWIYVLRFIKTRDRSLISSGADLFSTLTHCVRTIVAILLLPLSIIFVLVYFIRIYLLHNG